MAVSSNAKSSDIQNEQQLIEAASRGKLETVKALLECGTSVDAVGRNRALFYASKNYLTPLQMACKNGRTKCAEVLIANGADVNAADRFGVTALHMAAEKGHLACLVALLDANAECSLPTKFSKKGYYTAVPYRGGTTPLHLAAANNRNKCVEQLMQYGGDYNAVDELGRTSLYIAAQLGLSDCVLTHLRNAVGRDILSLPSFNTGDTPLHFAVSMGLVASVSALLKSGSDANHKNHSGCTPLHLAVSPSKDNEKVAMEVLQLLVVEGHNTDVNILDGCDLSPIHYVSFNSRNTSCQRPDMAKFLIAHGANPYICCKSKYSLLEYELKTPTDTIDVLKYLVRSLGQPPPSSKFELSNQPEANRDFANERGVRLDDYFTAAATRNERRVVVRERERMAKIKDQLAQGPTILELKQSWYESIASKPRTLQHFCRYSIRQALGSKLKNIQRLSVPPSMKSYLFLENGD